MATSCIERSGIGPVGRTCGECLFATRVTIDGIERAYCSRLDLWVQPEDRACQEFVPERDMGAVALAKLRVALAPTCGTPAYAAGRRN